MEGLQEIEVPLPGAQHRHAAEDEGIGGYLHLGQQLPAFFLGGKLRQLHPGGDGKDPAGRHPQTLDEQILGDLAGGDDGRRGLVEPPGRPVIPDQGGQMPGPHQQGPVPQAPPGQGPHPGIQGAVGVQDVHRRPAEEPAQPDPGPQVFNPAEDQGRHREILQPGPLVQLSPGITDKGRPVAAPAHGQGFHEDAPLLSAPAQGGLGLQDG